MEQPKSVAHVPRTIVRLVVLSFFAVAFMWLAGSVSAQVATPLPGTSQNLAPSSTDAVTAPVETVAEAATGSVEQVVDTGNSAGSGSTSTPAPLPTSGGDAADQAAGSVAEAASATTTSAQTAVGQTVAAAEPVVEAAAGPVRGAADAAADAAATVERAGGRTLDAATATLSEAVEGVGASLDRTVVGAGETLHRTTIGLSSTLVRTVDSLGSVVDSSPISTVTARAVTSLTGRAGGDGASVSIWTGPRSSSAPGPFRTAPSTNDAVPGSRGPLPDERGGPEPHVVPVSPRAAWPAPPAPASTLQDDAAGGRGHLPAAPGLPAAALPPAGSVLGGAKTLQLSSLASLLAFLILAAPGMGRWLRRMPALGPRQILLTTRERPG